MRAAAASSAPRPRAGDGAALAGWLARHETALVLAFVALAALVRALRWQVTAVMFNDGPVFLSLAEAFGRLDLETALGHPFHPLYSLLAAGVDLLVGRLETAAVIVSVASGSLAVLAISRLVRSGISPAHGVVAAGLLALHPITVEYTGDVQSEGLYLLLFLAAAAAALSALRRHSVARAFGAGALAGLAYLTRPEGLSLVVVAGAVAGLEALRGRRPWRETLGLGLALAAGLVLVAAPYLGWLRITEGTWRVTQKKSVSVLVGLEEAPPQGPSSGLPGPEEAPEAEPPAPPVPSPAAGPAAGGAAPVAAATPPAPEAAPDAPEPAVPPPPTFAESLWDLFQTHVRSLHYGTLFLLLLAAGLGIAGRSAPTYAAFVAVGVTFHALLLLGLSQGVGYVSGRHTLPPMTLLFGHAAGGLLAAAGFVHARWPRLPATAVAAFLALAVAGVGLGKALRPDRMDELAERRAAEWLREHRVTVRAVAARKQRVAWYAQAPFVEIPLAAYPDGLRELGVSHLILADDDRDHYPRLAETLHPPAVTLLHRVEAGGRTASIYVLPPRG